MKKTVAFLLSFLMIISLISCTNQENNETTANTSATTIKATNKINVKMSVLKGPTGMGASQMMSMNDAGKSDNNYTFKVDADPEAVISDLIAGNIDVAAIPTTSAANIYNKTDGKIRILGVSTLSVLNIVEKGNTITDIKSLKGKTILTSGQNTNVEYVLNTVLKENNLTPGKDVTIEFASVHAEVVTKAKSGSADIVLLPEPFVTQLISGSEEFRIAVNIKDEWKKISEFDLPMGVIAATSAFCENYDALMNFYSDYTNSVQFVNEAANLETASDFIAQYDILTKEIAKKAIPNSSIVFIYDAKMKPMLQDFFEKMVDENPQILGGKIPDNQIYYPQYK